MLSPPMSPAGRAALDEGLSPHPNKYCETVRERNLDRDRVPRPLSRSWRRARPLTPAAARAFRRQRDCEDAAALEGYRRERGTIERLARGRAPKCVGRALRRRGGAAAGARRGRGPALCVSLPGGSACRVSGPRFDAHTCAVVLHALEWHRHLRGAQDPDAALRDALRRAQCGASVLDAARARLAAANAREHELRPRGPKRPKTKKKGSSAGGARARAARVARRAARSAARAVADLENRLNAVLLDASGEPSARFRVGATSVVAPRPRDDAGPAPGGRALPRARERGDVAAGGSPQGPTAARARPGRALDAHGIVINMYHLVTQTRRLRPTDATSGAAAAS